MDAMLQVLPGNLVDSRVPVQVEVRDDGCIRIWVGSISPAPRLTSLILAHPGVATAATATASVILANANQVAMDAAVGAAKRFAQRYKSPIILSYPPEPLIASDEGTFRELEAALRRHLDSVINKS